MCAPNSAAILHDSPKYRASLAISFPTAVTAKTGIPYLSPSSTSLDKLVKVWFSYLLPTKIDKAKQEAFNFIASSIEVTISSLDKSSPIMLEPPETLRTIGILFGGGTEVL